VSIDLDVAERGFVTVGTGATVKLPSGTSVSSIGTVAQTKSGSDTSTVEVVVFVADRASSARSTRPRSRSGSRRASARTYWPPISALLALPEGGYGVQVVNGGSTRTVAVQPGMFAGGRVEIGGGGITAGTVVGVPA
jgi:hypothetical protein